MTEKTPFNIYNTYLQLPNIFYSFEKPTGFTAPKIVRLNEPLSQLLTVNSKELFNFLHSFNTTPIQTFAQAYAGHQFGGFTMLGDGRAIMLGEHVTTTQERFDVQIKGSGTTQFSRRGDGKATLKAMLREYLMSEAMFCLNIPTSRTLAVVKTGQPVFRETIQEAAAILRVMKSHIRVGTFEFAAYFGSKEDLQALTHYTAKRLYPHIVANENLALSLLNEVIKAQINLVVNWLRVGFIHGVMNTDNTAISGETFDYGPCAFMNYYHPKTVFSSIDTQGRYSFGNQPAIIKWNLAKFAEALLPLIHPDEKNAIDLAQQALDTFDDLWKDKYYTTMLHKIGLNNNPTHQQLIQQLLSLMQQLQLDYTNTFYYLSDESLHIHLSSDVNFTQWLQQWKKAINNSVGITEAQKIMQLNNPCVIPRNHLVEAALDEAVLGNNHLLEELLQAMSNAYNYTTVLEHTLQQVAPVDFDKSYQTFCGT